MLTGSRVFAGLIVALLHALAASAQENVTADMQTEVARTKDTVEAFFGQLAGPMPDAERAVREIIGDSPLKERTDDVKKLIDQAQSLDARVGVYKHHELVSSRNVGSDLVFLRYLYKGDKFPVVWHFTFYRTSGPAGLKGNWTLISLRFDTKVEALDR
jgi:hypothetical protein